MRKTIKKLTRNSRKVFSGEKKHVAPASYSLAGVWWDKKPGENTYTFFQA